ncbi:hydroxymethylglutaryl-CoA lyase, partial [Clostridioides difficile]|nr:hydroxymethylglutaryl-CoA lyase [Clostridioides difficile]
VFGCPFEGLPKIEDAIRFAKRLWENGIREMNLADTIGIADPKQVRETISALVEALPECRWQVHIHDTRNMGMVNTLVAIESGITTVQSTLGGLGGCPFAPGASGNTATEDLVY